MHNIIRVDKVIGRQSCRWGHSELSELLFDNSTTVHPTLETISGDKQCAEKCN